ncbi:MAG: PKD domain-containing protein [Bacteroidia bacterium]|nr:PKD domain-containing protein [Bacteroidia bacterium]
MKAIQFFFTILLCQVITLNSSLAADFFWVNGSGNWTDFSSHWATTSGGTTFHDSIPGPADRVFFDGNSFTAPAQVVMVDTSYAECLSIDFTGVGFSPSFTGLSGDTLNVQDDFILNNSLNWGYAGLLLFANGATTDTAATNLDTANIYLFGLTLNNECVFNGQGLWQLQDDFKTSRDIFFQQGSLEFFGDSIFALTFRVEDPVDSTISSGVSFSLQRSLDLDNAIIRISGAGTAWQVGGDATNLTADQIELTFTYTGNDTLFFKSDSVNGSLGEVFLPSTTVVVENGADIQSLNLAAGTDLKLVPNMEAYLNVNSISGSGSCGNYIELGSTIAGTQGYIRANGAGSTLSFVRIQDLKLDGNAISLTQSLDDGNVTGAWNITAPTSTSTYYWINDAGDWTDPTHWASTSGGTSNGCIPGPLDNVVFDANSFSIPGQSVNLDKNGYCADMDWSGMDENASLIGPAERLDVSGSLTLSALLNFSFSGNLRFTGLGDIRTAQLSIPGEIFFLGSTYTLQDSLIGERSINIESGNVVSNSRYLRAERIDRALTAGTLTLTGSEILLTGADTVWRTRSTIIGNIDVSGTSFTLTDPSQKGVVFEGDSLQYGALILQNSFTELLGSNQFSLISIDPGATLAIENYTTQLVDSIVANGSCDAPVFLQSVSPGTLAATLQKQGFPAVNINNAYITQLIADTTGGVTYTATNSEGFNETDGWTITGAAGGGDFYWIGGQGNWSDPANWSTTSGGTAGICIPGIGDNVIFDGNSFVAATDTVFGDITAFFNDMDWSAANLSPTFFQIRDLYPSGNVSLSPNMNWDKLGLATQMTFRPNSGRSIFQTQNLSLNTSISLLAENNTDTLELVGNLILDTLSSIVITRGTFLTGDNDIQAGTFFLATLEPKVIRLGASRIEMFFSWFILDVVSGLTFDAGTSEIFLGGFKSQTFFYGNGETYHNLTLLPTEGSNTQVNANNTFNNLTLAAGSDVVLPVGGTQTVNGNFRAVGTCEDSISLASFLPTVSSGITLATGSQFDGECMNIQAVNLNRGAGVANELVFFSTDEGQNQGFNFSATPATTASFPALGSICVEDSASFTSTSTAFSGNANDLSFIWDFGDGDSSFLANPRHKYSEGGDYPVTLQSTFTNGCSDTFKDTLEVREPTINLATSEPDFEFCQGESVTLRIADTTLTDYTFYINGNIISTGTANEITTALIQDGDQVYATAIVSGCLASSDTTTYKVIPGPNIQLTYTGSSNTVCAGDSILVLADGADLYEWFIDTLSQNFPSTDSTFLTTSLSPGQVIKVEGQDLSTRCRALSNDSVALNILPLPSIGMVSSDLDRIICEGEPVRFNASGATSYEFFIDGVSQQALSPINIFTTTSIQNNGVVSVEGTSQGCTNVFNFLPFTVNPTPNTLISSTDPDTSICRGDQVSFIASGASAYQFMLNGQTIGSISGNNTYVTDTLNDGDRVQVIGFLGDCADTSAVFDFEVIDLPIVGLSTTSPDSVCAGDPILFIASGATSYQFFQNGIALGGFSPSNTLTLTNLQTGDVITVAGNTMGCTANAPQQLDFVIKPLPVVSLFKVSSGNVFCEGETVNFAGVGANSYEYFVNGVSQGAPSIFGQIGLNLPPGNPIITLKGYTDGCEGISTDSIQVQVNPLPNVVISSSQSGQNLCEGDTVKVFANGAATYQFLLDGFPQGPSTAVDSIVFPNLQNGQLVRAVGLLNGCSDTSSNALTFNIDPVPVVSLAVSDPDLNICEGELLTFTSSGAGTYEFFLDGISLGAPTSSPTYTTDSLQNQQVVMVRGYLGNCQADAPNSISLTVNPAPQVNLLSSDPDTSICSGTSVSLTGSGAATYEFLLDGQSLAAPSLNNIYQTDSLQNGQSVQLIGYSTQNCPDTSGIYNFTVLPSPVVGFVSDDLNDRLCEGDTLTFTANGASSYEFFVNGISAQGPGPLASYATDSLGANQTVTVVGSLGVCEASADTSFSYFVDARPNPSLGIVGDAEICVGDSLSVLGSGAPQYQFLINGLAQGPASTDPGFTFPSLSNGQVISVLGINNDCMVPGDTSFQVIVNDFPTQVGLQSSDPSLSICFQDTITVTANGASIYEFFQNGFSISGPDSNNSIRLTELENGDIISARGAFGECFTNSNVSLNFQVTKLNLGLVSNPGNLLCEGDPVSLDASGADSYEFFINGQSQGASSSNSSLSLNNISDGSIATFAGTNLASGCVQRADEEVYFRVIPVADITPGGPIAICEGEELVLKTAAIGQLQWFLDGEKLIGERDDSLDVVEAGLYTIGTVQGGEEEAWTVGKNAQGQLGDTSNLDRELLEPATGNQIVTDVDAGQAFSLIATLDGKVFAWGDNSFGQLGDGSFIDRNAPQEVPSLSLAREVSAGFLHSLVLTQGGKVFAFGDNRAGQLGLGNNAVSSFPFEIPTLANIQQVESGANHSMAIDNQGQLYTWGENLEGQLGDSSILNKNTPQLISLSNVQDVAAGQNHSLALTTNGEVYGWGSNSRGQLGLDTLSSSFIPLKIKLPENIVDIAAGAVHSLFLGESGKLYVSGGNDQGQLGLDNLSDQFVPVELSSAPKGQLVFTGEFQSFVQLEDNSIFGWGRNVSGSLGNEDTVQVNSPEYLPLLTGAGEVSGGLDHLVVHMVYGVTCESAGVEVQINEAPAVSIIENQQSLTADPVGVSYQWFVNGLALVNDTSQSIMPTIGGDYTVEVTFANGCSRVSDPLNFIPVGLEGNLEGKLSIHPNPIKDVIWVEVEEGLRNLKSISFYDGVGKEVFKAAFEVPESKIRIELADLPPGLYSLGVEMTDGKLYWKKVLVIE